MKAEKENLSEVKKKQNIFFGSSCFLTEHMECLYYYFCEEIHSTYVIL